MPDDRDLSLEGKHLCHALCETQTALVELREVRQLEALRTIRNLEEFLQRAVDDALEAAVEESDDG